MQQVDKDVWKRFSDALGRQGRITGVAAALMVCAGALAAARFDDGNETSGQQTAAAPERPKSDDPGNSYWNLEVSTLAVSSDGRLVAAGGVDGAIHVWDATTGSLRHRLMGPFRVQLTQMRNVSGAAFQPHGELLAAAGEAQTVPIWHTDTGALIRTLVVPGMPYTTVWALAFSPDGERLATGAYTKAEWPRGQGAIHIWDMDGGRIVETPETEADVVYRAIAFSPDGKWLAAAFHRARKGEFASRVRLWDTTARQWGITLSPSRERSLDSVAFSPDSLLVVAGGGHSFVDRGTQCTGEADVWRVDTGAIQRTLARPEDGGDLAVSLSPEGQTVAGHSHGWAARDSGTRLWDLRSGRLLWASSFPPSGWPVSPVFFPDGKSLVACDGEAVRVLEVENGKTKRILMRVMRAENRPGTLSSHPNPVDVRGGSNAEGQNKESQGRRGR